MHAETKDKLRYLSIRAIYLVLIWEMLGFFFILVQEIAFHGNLELTH